MTLYLYQLLLVGPERNENVQRYYILQFPGYYIITVLTLELSVSFQEFLSNF